MADNVIEYLQENWEKLKLVGYFVLILALAAPLSEMLVQAWIDAGLEGGIARDIIGVRYLVGADLEAVSIFVFGLYLGLLALMTVDSKKRWQAFLLWIGTIVGLLVLQSMGRFLPNVNLVARFPVLVGGLLVGVLIGGGRELAKVKELGNSRALEFRNASRVLYLLLAGFTVVGFLELHLTYPNFLTISQGGIEVQSMRSPAFRFTTNGIVWHAGVSALFIVTLRQFVKYDAEKEFFILGPRASGKSLFLIGAYLEALDRSRSRDDSTPLKPSEDLMEMLEALDRQESDWIVEATGRGELKHLQFQYVHGSVFPVNIRLSAMDYAGEYLTRLPDAITGAISQDEMDTTLQRLAQRVEKADTLMFVVDIERFVNNEPLEISEYFTILQATDNKDVVIVGTKADVLADDFKDERGLDAHLHFEEFKQFVNTRLRQSENVDSLVTETAGTEVHPVYYQTKVNENGNRVPMRDDSGSVMTVGFTELLDKIGRM